MYSEAAHFVKNKATGVNNVDKPTKPKTIVRSQKHEWEKTTYLSPSQHQSVPFSLGHSSVEHVEYPTT